AADFLRVAPLVFEHPDLDRILLLPFLVERDAIVAGDGEAQRIADRRHPHAEIRGAPAVDRDVDLRIRDAQLNFRIGDAGQLLRRLHGAHRIVVQLPQVGPENVRRDREAALAFAAAECGSGRDARPRARILRETAPYFADDLGLRDLPLLR